MQLGLLGLILGMPNTGSAIWGGEGEATGGSAGSDMFSQLLGDGNAQNFQGRGGQGLLVAAEVSKGALLAQDLNLEQLASLQAAGGVRLTELLAAEITPEDAAVLIAKIDALQLSQGAKYEHTPESDVWDQLKEGLQEIEASGEPQQVSELLESLPVPEGLEGDNERPIVQRMLQWLDAALNKRKEAPTPTDADAAEVAAVTAASPGATAISLQASLFRADDAAGTPADAGAAAQEKEKTRDIIEIVPLSQPITVSIPEWVRKLGEPVVSAEIDAAIPSLALNAEETLPDVDLPQVGLQALVADDVVLPQTDMPEFTESLKPLMAYMSAKEAIETPTTQMVKLETPAVPTVEAALPAPDEKTPAIREASNKTVQAAPVDFVQTASAEVAEARSDNAHTLHAANSQKAAAMPAAYNAAGAGTLPHTPVAEQVHVAISRSVVEGVDKITLQLEPADLGRVEVKMHIIEGGKTHVAFLVDKAETLDMLSRDARSLERSLQESGIKADAGSMEFNLRQPPQTTHNGTGDGQHQPYAPIVDEDEHVSLGAEQAIAEAATRNLTINVDSGVDIRA